MSKSTATLVVGSHFAQDTQLFKLPKFHRGIARLDHSFSAVSVSLWGNG